MKRLHRLNHLMMNSRKPNSVLHGLPFARRFVLSNWSLGSGTHARVIAGYLNGLSVAAFFLRLASIDSILIQRSKVSPSVRMHLVHKEMRVETRTQLILRALQSHCRT